MGYRKNIIQQLYYLHFASGDLRHSRTKGLPLFLFLPVTHLLDPHGDMQESAVYPPQELAGTRGQSFARSKKKFVS